MKLVVGLGNPGREYQGTRHNVGFEVIDYLANGPGAGSFRSRHQAQICELREGESELLLAKPETFMNLSGRAVRQIVDFYKIPIEDVLIICDDINLPLGKLRMRTSGSHGGQNGLRNIQEILGTDEYARLRVGVDQPTHDASSHVLSKFRPGERDTIDEAIANAARAVLTWAARGAEACMNQVNGAGKQKPKKPKPESAPEPPA